ncbi:hypothetical protein TYRP_013561 [Tyrophagus putrescentiae]|nr:hypothetical protein TYRP_013561 [Tyrophagus putrescentiae]
MLVTALPGAAEDSRVKVSRSTRPFGGEEAEEGDSEEVEKEEEMGLKLEDTSPSFKASISEATLSTGDSGELGYIIIDDLLMGDMARWMNSFSCIGSLLMDELKREKMTLFAVSSALVANWHLSPYLHDPTSAKLRHSSVLYREDGPRDWAACEPLLEVLLVFFSAGSLKLRSSFLCGSLPFPMCWTAEAEAVERTD